MRDLSRKNIALWSITIALGLSIISNIVIISNYPQPLHIKDPTILVIATASGPHTLEIVDVLDTDWRHVSNGVLEQVVETLFSHDLRDPDLPRITGKTRQHFRSSCVRELYFMMELHSMQARQNGTWTDYNTS
jgi:hypothetical protein